MHCLAWHPSAQGRAYGPAATARLEPRRRPQLGQGGRRARPHFAWALAVDAADPDRWFGSAAPGPFEAHGSGPSDSAIYRSEHSGP